jgi:hypothetical protein
MDAQDAHMVVLESELLILRAMCVGAADRRVWQDAANLLGDYPFRDPLHLVVFDTLREINTDDPRIIRGLLGARLTNKGFPDVETSSFFAAPNLKATVLLAMMDSLRSLARRRPSPEVIPASRS